ncbi:MAG: TolC family protein [Saprospiraceae bacterium]|nr:TolC family protein [Saprospiraceae bacterium]
MSRFILFTLISFSSFLIHAQEVWSLQKCIATAQRENLNLRLSKLNVNAAQLDLTENKWRRSPDLNASVNSGISVGRNIDPTTNLLINQDILFGSGSLSSTVALFQGFAINNSIKQSKINLLAGTEDLKQAENDLALLVANQYLTVLLSEERKQIAEENLKIREKTLQQINTLFQSGARPEADVFEAKSQIAMVRQTLVQAENALTLSFLSLKQSLRLPSDAPMVLEKLSESQAILLSLENYVVEDMHTTSTQNLPIIKAAKHRLDAAKVGEKIARSVFYPSVFGSVNIGSRYSDAAVIPKTFDFETITIPGISIDGKSVVFQQLNPRITSTEVIPFNTQFDQFLGYSFGLGINIPIFNQMRNWTNVKRSKLQTKRTGIQLEIQTEKLRQDITQAYTQALASSKDFEAATISSELAIRSYEMTQKRFELGAASLFELGQAQSNRQITQNNLIIARYDLAFRMQILEFYSGRTLKF